MNIEILHIDECPNWEETGERVRTALNATGHPDVAINYRLLTTAENAAAVAFAGTPTILLNGTDVFPSGGRTFDLACRIYRTATGFSGMPAVDQLIQALTTSK